MTSHQQESYPGWGFWLRWVLASSVGLAVGEFVGRVLGWDISHAVLDAIVSAAGVAGIQTPAGRLAWVGAWIAGGAVGAPVLGLTQWLVLRRQISQAGWWMLTTSVGWIVGWGAGFAVLATPHPQPVVAGAMAGVGIGLLQWSVLRRHVSRAGWWILACSVSWALSWTSFALGGLLASLVGVVGVAAITGTGLVWLLQ